MAMKRFLPGQRVWVRFFNGMDGGSEQWVSGVYIRLDRMSPTHGVRVHTSMHYFLDEHIMEEEAYVNMSLAL